MADGLSGGASRASTTYCRNLTAYSRYRTREVAVGDVPLGADHPIRIQSMTTTDTMDTRATVEQTIRIAEAGADYVRITAPSQNEARNLEAIQTKLHKRGFKCPLIADIHYTPRAAEIAARIVDKIRINPGNYADKKKFQVLEYSEAEYAAELDRIRDRLTPLVRICKEYGTAMRIGTNHGSLSDRIMSRFGDTPLGMVESALEFARVCRDLGYNDLVFSMKASNPQVVVQAYRLLVNRMAAEGMDYPLHLGVTEAGEGEDGRIKSAVGIGTLLEDGLGDTIRVSLTEEPEAEIPVCVALVERYRSRPGHDPIPSAECSPGDPYSYRRRPTREVCGIGGDAVPVVIASSRVIPTLDATPDYIHQEDSAPARSGQIPRVLPAASWRALDDKASAYPLFPIERYPDADDRSERLNFVLAALPDLTEERLRALEMDDTAVLVLRSDNVHAMPEMRRALFEVMSKAPSVPVVLKREYSGVTNDELILFGATDLGGLLVDGLGDGIWIEAPDASPDDLNRLAFGILQATRTRISRTDYISCPSCGRTLFELQGTTARIRGRTNHLKGLKIAVMGCIVNGPGEMADADYGYVGSGPGQITLYRGKEIVERSIPTEGAVDALIELIKRDNKWVEPESS
ncbi:MAG: (E)-4-hydroxy-3-methylbut-2-enyl-diphosphate synthase [Candidatus Latescibacteria bacterium]|nr:(E)-4-hydroxy-3-methylbut-2-enyl-diphosphate synthase [Candidatus Latescibacterota bacterium]